jgi:hypothetical protein
MIPQAADAGHVEDAEAASSLNQGPDEQGRMAVMSRIRQFDHVGITGADLDSVTAFFFGLGLDVEGRTFVEGAFIDTVIAPQTRGQRSSCCGRRAEAPGSSS